jgi:DNA-binding MarR family transcriptional regulator
MARPTRLKPVAVRSEAAAPYVLDDQVGFLMRVSMQRHTAIFMSKMIEGLTQPQFAALAKLHEVGPCSQNHLGRLIYLDAATIKGIVDRLRLRRFVTTQGDPRDRRRRVAEAAIVVAAQITADTLAPLTEDERRTIARLLKRLG